GFWRYRLGDVVEVLGFDPRDGQPVVRHVEVCSTLSRSVRHCYSDRFFLFVAPEV
ncbi:hypothetical protein BKA83DRAFT_4178909, partial [Pisolithus microcarpus]